MIKNDSFSYCCSRTVLWHGNHHVSAEPVSVMEILNVLAEILPVIALVLIILWVGKNNPVEPDDRLILPPEDWDRDWYKICEEEEKAEKQKKGSDGRDYP